MYTDICMYMYIYIYIYMMMMIAFITNNSGLVPLIEGLCAQIYNFRFEIIGGLHSHLLLFFLKRQNMLKEKTVSPRSHPASWHIHTHVYFVHTYEYIYMPRFGPSEFFGPSRCLIPTPVLTTEYPICAVYVCVCVQIHTQTRTLALDPETRRPNPD